MSDDSEVSGKLIPDGDYILEDGCAWIEVDGFSFRIRRTADGVQCSIYQSGRELDEELASAVAFTEDLVKDDGSETK